MHRFVKPNDHRPVKSDDGHNDRKELNNAQYNEGDKPLSLVVTAIHLLERSKRRAALFESSLTANAGWDILLLLYIYQSSGTPVSYDVICQETGLSEDTARRYIKAMHQDGLTEPAAMTLSATAKIKMETLLSSANRPIAEGKA